MLLALTALATCVQEEPAADRIFRPARADVQVPAVYDPSDLFARNDAMLKIPAWALSVYLEDLAVPGPSPLPPMTPPSPILESGHTLTVIAPPARAVPCPPR